MTVRLVADIQNRLAQVQAWLDVVACSWPGWLLPLLSAWSAGAPTPGYQLGKSLSLVIPDLRMP